MFGVEEEMRDEIVELKKRLAAAEADSKKWHRLSVALEDLISDVFSLAEHGIDWRRRITRKNRDAIIDRINEGPDESALWVWDEAMRKETLAKQAAENDLGICRSNYAGLAKEHDAAEAERERLRAKLERAHKALLSMVEALESIDDAEPNNDWEYTDVIREAREGQSSVSFDPERDRDALCECGHPYYRHFDTYNDMLPVGCKYCPCPAERADATCAKKVRREGDM